MRNDVTVQDVREIEVTARTHPTALVGGGLKKNTFRMFLPKIYGTILIRQSGGWYLRRWSGPSVGGILVYRRVSVGSSDVCGCNWGNPNMEISGEFYSQCRL